MKRNLQILISASAASVLAFSAFAQDSPDPKADRPEFTRDRVPLPQRSDQLNSATKASDIIGIAVKNYQDEKLGKVDDLAVDVESGRIVQVILSTGGFLGIGDTLTAVPPGALHHDLGQKVLHLDADKTKLKSAPKFETAKWAENSSSNQVSEVYRHYGQLPYFTVVSGASYDDLEIRNSDATRTSDRIASDTRDKKVKEITNAREGNVPNTEGTANRRPEPLARYGNKNKSALNRTESPLGYVQQASKILGITVMNLQGEKLGKVENLIVDLQAGRIVTVVISSGGFLGMGSELSMVPPTALRLNTDRDGLQLDATKETLTSAPHFKADQWPDFNQASYSEGIYRAYQVEPYFTTDATTEADKTRLNIRDRDDRTPGATEPDITPRKVNDRDDLTPKTTEPDNTARNIRDRKDQTLTPLNQGNSKADVATTAQIRKEIIAGKNLSVNARNVKVITIDGRVTLRGPVKTSDEKRVIGEIADRSVHSGNVDNQLEVEASTDLNK